MKLYNKSEHIWRLGRGSLVILSAVLWMLDDGDISKMELMSLGVMFLVFIYEQLHGVICVSIEKLLEGRAEHDLED